MMTKDEFKKLAERHMNEMRADGCDREWRMHRLRNLLRECQDDLTPSARQHWQRSLPNLA
jgi:hypothetical protein